jgi:hypothetical protein
LESLFVPDAGTEIIDFETSAAYLLSADNNYGVSADLSTNPRKRDPNTSDMVCRINQNIPEDAAYNPNNAYIIVSLDSLFRITSEKSYLSFQTYRNGYDVDFILGVKTKDDNNIYGTTFSSVNRVWQEYQLNLNSLINKKIESVYIFPNKNFNETTSGTEEYIYFDNILLSGNENEAQNISIIEISPLPTETYLCDFTFEHKNVFSIPSAEKCGLATIQTNPVKQENNASDRACKSSYTFSSDPECDYTQFHIALNPFPPITLSDKKPYLHFQAMKNTNPSEIAIEIKLKNNTESVYKTFSMEKRRTWKDFTLDLSAHAGETIENILLYPNLNNPQQPTDECYFDNILLSDKKPDDAGIENIQPSESHRFFTQNNILHVLHAENSFLSVYTIDMKLIYNNKINSSHYQLTLNKGIYLLGINNKFYKLII